MTAAHIRPNWPAPAAIKSAVTVRHGGGASEGDYGDFNLATHVGDDPARVAANRTLLCKQLTLPAAPEWLEQVHGCDVIDLDADTERRGDAAVTATAGRVAAVMTADCLPVLFANRAGTKVAVAHCGWRGLAAGVLAATVLAMDEDPAELLAWLGPAISQGAYEVGDSVRDAFLGLDSGHDACFIANDHGRWQANLYALARRMLSASGVEAIFGGGFCTYYDQRRFFSYRRQGQCGRMASLIWLAH